MKVKELLYSCVKAENVIFVNEDDVLEMPLEEYICSVDIISECLLDAEVQSWEVDGGDITIKYKETE